MRHSGKSVMLKFDEAFDRVMGSARQLGTERVGLGCALNRTLAEDVTHGIEIQTEST